MGSMAAGRLAELLRRHRTAAGLSQRQLARASGLSERAIRDLERGLRTPRPQSARLLAGALALDRDDLTTFLAAGRSAPGGGEWRSEAGVSMPSDDLVGRDDELRALFDLVVGGRHRLVTVTGPAGIGKSRIVAALATLLAHRTDVDVHTLDLSAVREPDLVGELVAAALGCGPSRLAAVPRVAAHLGDRRVVLVVDRFEHLVGAASELVLMVRRCPGLRVVVTSQRRLQVRDERVVVLPVLSPAAAATLFTRRAQAAGGTLVADGRSMPAAEAICARIGHLPLAIELAAAQARLMHPLELYDRLDRQLPLLAGGARDLPRRHRSLRAAIESTLEVVAADARTVFRWFGALTGGARLGDIEAVADGLGYGREWLLAALAELVDINLVRVTTAGATSRYVLPDPIAELAAEQLETDTDRLRVERAVATRILTRLGTLAVQDAPNVRGAVRWAVAHEPTLVEEATLTRFYEATGRLAEGQSLLLLLGTAGGWVGAGQLAALRGNVDTAVELGTRALRAAGSDHAVRVSALNLLAQVAVERGDPATGRTYLRAALVAARRAGDVALLGRVLNNLASVSVEHGRLRDAERQMRAALTAKRRSGAGPVELGRTLFNLAEIALDLGHTDSVVARAAEAVPLLLVGGFSRLAALAEATAALAVLRRHGPGPAVAAVERALGLLRDDGGDDRRTAAVVRLRCSVVQHAAGQPAVAAQALRDAVRTGLDQTSRDRDAVADALQGHAAYLARTDPESAAALLGAGDRVRRRPIAPAMRDIRDHAVAAARDALGTALFDRRNLAGAALGIEDLAALCVRIDPHG